MSSNSIRVDEKLFSAARVEGETMSRSAAQQIEHWARLGAALEAVGLTVGEAADLLRAGRASPHAATGTTLQDLWAFKRQRQAADLRNVAAGRASNADMSWFSGGKARAARLVDSPY